MSQVPVNLPISRNSVCKESVHGSVHGWSDFAGLAVSIACAIHCAALPVLLAILPSWGMGLLAHHSFHKWMFAACFLVAIVAFIPGLLRHRRVMPMTLGALGLACLGLGAFSEDSMRNCNCERCTERKVENDQSIARSKVDRRVSKPLASVVNHVDGMSSENTNTVFKMPDVNAVATQEAQDPQTSDRSGLNQGSDNGATAGIQANATTDSQSPSTIQFCCAFLLAWITPIGGLLLVSAHLSNHHFGSYCGCQ